MPQLNYQDEYFFSDLPESPIQAGRDLRSFNYQRIYFDEGLEDKRQPLEFKKLFWLSLMVLLILPILNSSIYNLIFFAQNLSLNFRLQSQKTQLEKELEDFQERLKEINSLSGLRRTIIEEVGLVDSHEIVLKIED